MGAKNIKWPLRLVEDIARRQAVIYLGSGISASSENEEKKRPPTWEGFLKKIVEEKGANLDENQNNGKGTEVKKVINRLIREKNYLMACEVILDKLGDKTFRELAEDEFSVPGFKHNRLHELIRALDSRIVLTPNVDSIYEDYARESGGVIVKSYADKDLAKFLRPRLTDYLVIKVHGSIHGGEPLVFTQSQYSKSRNEHMNFYKILDALLLTKTFVFLGCGITDPDIQLALENMNFSFPDCREHYMVIPSKGISKTELKCLSQNRNLNFLEYDNSDGMHSCLLSSLEELSKEVDIQRKELVDKVIW